MLQHDITNNKYYHDGVEISAEEYAVLRKEWEDNLPPPSTGEPDEIDDAEAFEIIFGGGAT